MVRFQKFWQFFLVGTCVFWSTAAWAQNAVFSANASATKIGLNDQLQVDYRIENVSSLRSISKPDFKDFIIVGGPFSSQSSNISIVGNKMVQSQSYTHSYVLQPKKTGTLSIPPAIAKDANGATYESNALTVQVVNGSIATRQQQSNDPFDDPFNDPFAAMMQQRRQAMQAMQQQRQQRLQPQEAPITDMKDIYKNLFIRVSVDKTKAYVGEQITASYKLYARMPMNVAISKLPSLNGFWTQDFILPGQGALKPEEEVINGKTYQVFLLKKSALFPQQTGSLTLDPAEAEGQARIITQSQQKNPFGSMF
ncbi:MAG: BatD family protein, partial [Bacteroidetes bacterium]|nr:BatD family protein [Bacteroidota bacterium]